MVTNSARQGSGGWTESTWTQSGQVLPMAVSQLRLGVLEPPGGPAPSLCTTSEMFNLKSSCCIPWEEVICMSKNTNQLGRCEAHLFLKY